jgi:hypothetical protein
MKLKTFLTLNAISAMLIGAFFALEWFFAAQFLIRDLPGLGFSGDLEGPEPYLLWGLASFMRLFGMMLFGLGALTFAVRDVNDRGLRRGILIAQLLTWFFATFTVLSQQIAIWDTPAGWVLVVYCAVLALGYAVYFVQDILEAWRPRPQPLSREDQEYNLELIRYATQNYGNLQGLRMIPMGLWYFAVAAGWLGKQGDLTYSWPALILAIGLWFALGLYYRHRFGRVNHAGLNLGVFKLGANSPIWLMVGLVIGWIIFVILSALALFDTRFNLPISTMGMVIAIGVALVWCLPSFRRRMHYLVISILIAGISFLPLVGIFPQSDANGYPGGPILFIAFGLVFTAGGLLDHLILLQAFKPLPKEASHE